MCFLFASGFVGQNLCETTLTVRLRRNSWLRHWVIALRIVGYAGIVLFFWAFGHGFATDRYSRAKIFVGPIGVILNILALLLGAGMMAVGLLRSMMAD